MLVVLALLTLFPVILIVSTTLKTPQTCGSTRSGCSHRSRRRTSIDAWTVGGFGDYLVNSILLCVPSTLLVVVLSTMAGYAFARLPFPGRTAAFYLVVLGLLVPFFTYMIPLYFQLRSMGLLDTLLGANLVLTDRDLLRHLLHAGLLLRPAGELEQAARVDGGSEWQIFLRIMVPLVSSGMGALAVFTFLSTGTTSWSRCSTCPAATTGR